MGGTCHTPERDDECIQHFSWKKMKGKKPFGGPVYSCKVNVTINLTRGRAEMLDRYNLSQHRITDGLFLEKREYTSSLEEMRWISSTAGRICSEE
jgi:hypothetical protein